MEGYLAHSLPMSGACLLDVVCEYELRDLRHFVDGLCVCKSKWREVFSLSLPSLDCSKRIAFLVVLRDQHLSSVELSFVCRKSGNMVNAGDHQRSPVITPSPVGAGDQSYWEVIRGDHRDHRWFE